MAVAVPVYQSATMLVTIGIIVVITMPECLRAASSPTSSHASSPASSHACSPAVLTRLPWEQYLFAKREPKLCKHVTKSLLAFQGLTEQEPDYSGVVYLY